MSFRYWFYTFSFANYFILALLKTVQHIWALTWSKHKAAESQSELNLVFIFISNKQGLMVSPGFKIHNWKCEPEVNIAWILTALAV